MNGSAIRRSSQVGSIPPLAWNCAALPGVVEAVATQTAFPCQVVNPFDGMVLGPEVKAGTLAMEATSYLVATGLALRRFHP